MSYVGPGKGHVCKKNNAFVFMLCFMLFIFKTYVVQSTLLLTSRAVMFRRLFAALVQKLLSVFLVRAMPPKKDANAKAKAVAKAQAAEDKKRKKATQEAEAAQEEEQKKLAMSNLVMQGRKEIEANPDSESVLAQVYKKYLALPLRSEEKGKLALLWKNDKGGQWMNSYFEDHSTILTDKRAGKFGWTTSFKIAKEMNMDHKDEVFQNIILPTLKKQGPEGWDPEDTEEAAYKVFTASEIFVFNVLVL